MGEHRDEPEVRVQLRQLREAVEVVEVGGAPHAVIEQHYTVGVPAQGGPGDADQWRESRPAADERHRAAVVIRLRWEVEVAERARGGNPIPGRQPVEQPSVGGEAAGNPPNVQLQDLVLVGGVGQ